MSCQRPITIHRIICYVLKGNGQFFPVLLHHSFSPFTTIRVKVPPSVFGSSWQFWPPVLFATYLMVMNVTLEKFPAVKFNQYSLTFMFRGIFVLFPLVLLNDKYCLAWIVAPGCSLSENFILMLQVPLSLIDTLINVTLQSRGTAMILSSYAFNPVRFS